MTGGFFLDWLILTVSLFNTIALLWLGLTVLLNVERRSWGIALAGGGLLAGGAFFVIHSAILGNGLRDVSGEMNVLWHLGWAPIIASPFAWYVVMLWYAGFWEQVGARESPLRGRQRPWLGLTILLALALVGVFIFANPLPSYTQVVRTGFTDAASLGSFSLLVVSYSLYNVICIGAALDALLRPGFLGSGMGARARARARPWLVTASLVLLLVSLLVAVLVFSILLNGGSRAGAADLTVTIAGFDLVIAALIAVAVLAIGQAVVTYEIFTGKTLPRRGLLRQWRSAVILAAGFSVVIAWSLSADLRPIYGLLLSTLVLTIFYALFGWRSYTERERYIKQLRPFVTSERLYDRLLTPSFADPSSVTEGTPTEIDAAAPFRALCEEVLGARLAYLVALGPMSSLFGAPLAYAPLADTDNGGTIQLAPALVAQFASPNTMGAPIEPDAYGGAQWAVPLWSERGLIGALLLGEKRDGGLYAQEEIEIARASGERLIDTKASAEMARRLIALQRQRLAEGQVLDRRARRTLHDEILPRLHTVLLSLDGAAPDAINLLTQVHREIADLLRAMPAATAQTEITRLGLVGALRRAVDSEFASAFDAVTWRIEPKVERAAEQLPALTAEVVYYAAREVVRNAARHGRDGASPLHLTIGAACREGLELTIEDDGIGVGAAASGNGGTGQGLGLHSTMMAVVGGALAVASAAGRGTRVVLTLPLARL